MVFISIDNMENHADTQSHSLARFTGKVNKKYIHFVHRRKCMRALACVWCASVCVVRVCEYVCAFLRACMCVGFFA